MTAVNLGTGVTLIERFLSVDPVTEVATLADPTTVTFEVADPDGNVTAYVFGADPEVENPSVGIFLCRLSAAQVAQVGDWSYIAVGTGSVEVTSSPKVFTVLEPGVLPRAEPGRATLGPCTSWIDGTDVAACCRVDYGSNAYVLDQAAFEASMALYEISGRKFPGECERTVRPCADRCGCFAGPVPGFGWQWATLPNGWWGWVRGDECGSQTCGCRPLSRVKLSGYPVHEILQVKIDGDAVDPSGYRLDEWRYLTRLGDGRWPGCQDLTLPDDEPGTFSVTYRFGSEPPQLGRDAAAQIACQIFAACNPSGGDCVLPEAVTRVTRQGIEVERSLLANWFDETQGTGLVAVDLFLRAYADGKGGRRPAVFSPDVPGYARPV